MRRARSAGACSRPASAAAPCALTARPRSAPLASIPIMTRRRRNLPPLLRPWTAMRRGEAAERAAEAYLAARGLILLARNYRSPHGEIDLIMQDGQTVVFVEVRQRRN